ncbi:MAG: hypothetical protein Fur005_22490 [Roseiflexaceae bacterium]
MMKATFNKALQAFHHGDRDMAFRLLRQVILDDSRYAPAWYWLSRLVEDENRKRECLEYAIAIDSEYREAQEALESIKLHRVVSGFRAPVFQEYRREPLRLGQALIQRGLLSPIQLQEALREQHQEHNRGKKVMLGMILLRRKMVAPLALASVLVDQQLQRTEPDRLGDYLLANQMISRESLELAIAEHALTCVYEKPIRFGELLVQSGYISQEDLDHALEEQRRDAFNKYYY